MRAFVLSGAGNRGPIEAGALIALLESGIQPDMLVGTSAGAINGLFLAAHGATLGVAQKMPALWRGISAKDVYVSNVFQTAWRLITKKNSLYPNVGMRRMLTGMLPKGVETFADLKVPLYTTAVDIRAGRLFSFGAIHQSQTPLVDIVMASATVPAIHPPVNYRELQLVDGGLIANVAASVAMRYGAKEIYLVNAGRGLDAEPVAQGIPEIISATLSTIFAQSLLRDVARAEADDKIDLHHIHLDAFRGTWFRDFSKSDLMVEAGYSATKTYLADPSARAVKRWDDHAAPPPADLPPGAEEILLSSLQ